jgi:hypothetical protein
MSPATWDDTMHTAGPIRHVAMHGWPVSCQQRLYPTHAAPQWLLMFKNTSTTSSIARKTQPFHGQYMCQHWLNGPARRPPCCSSWRRAFCYLTAGRHGSCSCQTLFCNPCGQFCTHSFPSISPTGACQHTGCCWSGERGRPAGHSKGQGAEAGGVAHSTPIQARCLFGAAR